METALFEAARVPTALSSQQSSYSTPVTETSQAEWHLNFVIPEIKHLHNLLQRLLIPE